MRFRPGKAGEKPNNFSQNRGKKPANKPPASEASSTFGALVKAKKQRHGVFSASLFPGCVCQGRASSEKQAYQECFRKLGGYNRFRGV